MIHSAHARNLNNTVGFATCVKAHNPNDGYFNHAIHKNKNLFENKEFKDKFQPSYFFEIVGWVLLNGDTCVVNSSQFSLHCAQTDVVIQTVSIEINDRFFKIKGKINNNLKVLNLKINNIIIFQLMLDYIIKSTDYLTPTQLIPKTVKQLKKVLILGPCTASWTCHYLTVKFPEIIFKHITFLNTQEIIVDDIDTYDISIVLWTPLSFTCTLFNHRNYYKETYWEHLLDTSTKKLKIMLVEVFNKCKMSVFVSNLIAPVGAPEISISRGKEFRRFIQRFNDVIEDNITQYSNMCLLDVNSIAEGIGKNTCTTEPNIDPEFSNWVLTSRLNNRYPAWRGGESDYLMDYIEYDFLYHVNTQEIHYRIFEETKSLFQILNQDISVKMVVFDLDDTMWVGRVADHYREFDTKKYSHELTEVPTFTTWQFNSLHRTIQTLIGRGILVSIISKNDESIVLKYFNKILSHGVKYEDFINPKINWEDKTINMQNLLSEVGLTSKNVVFVDDNPNERANMLKVFPDMRILGDSPYDISRILRWSSATQIYRFTDEAKNRKNSIIKTVQNNKKLHTNTIDKVSFLQSLQLKGSLIEIKDTDTEFGRAFELLNKTNQFNTTGKRWDRRELLDLLLVDSNKILLYSLEDESTNYGIISTIILKTHQIEQFVMSCRVIGLDVEHNILHLLKTIYKCDTLVLTPTEHNSVCQNFVKSITTAQGITEGIVTIDNNNIFVEHKTTHKIS